VPFSKDLSVLRKNDIDEIGTSHPVRRGRVRLSMSHEGHENFHLGGTFLFTVLPPKGHRGSAESSKERCRRSDDDSPPIKVLRCDLSNLLRLHGWPSRMSNILSLSCRISLDVHSQRDFPC